jgi:hypothetical protein
MVPLSATRARAKMHRVGFIWPVRLVTDATYTRVKVGLPFHIEWYNNRYAREIHTVTEPKREVYALRT